MDDAPFVPVGRVVKPHGVQGEVSVAFAFGPPFELKPGSTVWAVPPSPGAGSLTVEQVRPGPKGPLVKLSGIDDRTGADLMRGRTLLVHRDSLPAGLDSEEPDLTGADVHDEEKGLLGRIEETLMTGANDVWIVRGERFGEVLIPVIDDVVLSVDHESRMVRVRLLPGLIEEE